MQVYPKCLERKPELPVVNAGSPSLKTRETLAIMACQVLIDRGGLAVLFSRLLQIGEGRFDHNTPRVPFLAVRSRGSGQAKRADKMEA